MQALTFHLMVRATSATGASGAPTVAPGISFVQQDPD
jgi:hypothetical protein